MIKRQKNKKRIIALIITILAIVLFGFIIVTLISKKEPYQNNEIKKENENVEIKEAKENVVIEDKYVDLEITYLGSAKLKDSSCMNAGFSEEPREEDEKDDIYISYTLLGSKREFLYIKNDPHYGIYDEDFEIKFNKEKCYLFSYGRKLTWFQYNPGEVSQFGGIASRAGADWSIDRVENVIYFYEIDFNGPGYLADMFLEF